MFVIMTLLLSDILSNIFLNTVASKVDDSIKYTVLPRYGIHVERKDSSVLRCGGENTINSS